MKCLIILVAFLTGCASIRSGENELRIGIEAHRSGDHLGAFSVLSSLATSAAVTNDITKNKARQYLLQNQEIGMAGLASLTLEQLWKSSLVVGDSTAREIMMNDLNALESIYKEHELATSIAAQRSLIQKPYHFILKNKLEALSSSQQKILNGNYLLKIVTPKELGKIEGIDTLEISEERNNRSGAASTAIASLMYVDSRPKIGSYSPEVHFAAMVIGQVIGTSFSNNPTDSYRRIKYGIKLMSGEFKYAEVRSFSSVTHATGACVYMGNMMLVNVSACE
jgi:hypothetical protein